MDGFDLSGVEGLLKGISSPVEIANVLDEYFEVSSYLKTVSVDDLRKNFYSSFMQLLCEALEDVCKFFQNKSNPKDTRNIKYWASFLQDLEEDLSNENLTAKDARAWLRCFHRQLLPHEALLKSRNNKLFSVKTGIEWFQTKNFTPGNEPDCNHNIREYLEDVQAVDPKFLDHIWSKLNNLYLICEVDDLLTDAHLEGVLRATRNTIDETKEGRINDLKEGTMRKVEEFKALFAPEVKQKLLQLTNQAVRQNHDTLMEKLPGLENQIPKTLWQRMPFAGNLSISSVLQTITRIVNQVGAQPYSANVDTSAIPTTLHDLQTLSGISSWSGNNNTAVAATPGTVTHYAVPQQAAPMMNMYPQQAPPQAPPGTDPNMWMAMWQQQQQQQYHAMLMQQQQQYAQAMMMQQQPPQPQQPYPGMSPYAYGYPPQHPPQ